MSRKPPISRRAAERLGERERALGIDADDAAAQWLAENDATPAPPPGRAPKSKLLHRWRRGQQRPK